MVRRYYKTGGLNVGDPAIGSLTITDPFFEGKKITGVFKEGFRYYVPLVEWSRLGNTVSILNGVQLAVNEVIEVEVELPYSVDDTPPVQPVVDSDPANPFLPDIIKSVAVIVDQYFSTRDDDPFNVKFNAGIYSQVTRDLYIEQTGAVNPEATPLIWLVMNYDEVRGGARWDLYSQVVCSVIIAMATNNSYTQEERTDNVFRPRLLPIYQKFMKELSRETRLQNSLLNKIEHFPIQRPYWGGGDQATADTKNLFRNFVDAIEIKRLKLNVKRSRRPCVITG